MQPDKKIIQALDTLIAEGSNILDNARDIGFSSKIVDSRSVTKWKTQVEILLPNINATEPQTSFVELYPTYGFLDDSSRVEAGVGILEGVKAVIQNGYLVKVSNLVAVEIFSDNLELATQLLNEQHYGPAAIITGVVLENTLRKCFENKQINMNDQANLHTMNQQLFDKKIYSKIIFNQIRVYADLRNAACHAKWDEFKTHEVVDMIKWVTRFAEQELQES